MFADWIRCCSLAISNSCQLVHDKVWNDREQIYLDTVRKYTKSEVQKFVEMFEMLAETFEDYTSDVLGEIYMESRMGNKATGQFFTPFHLSVLCAKMVEENLKPDADGIYYLNEPSVGGGGMVIAAAVVLKEKGINYQKKLRVVAQDLDWKGV